MKIAICDDEALCRKQVMELAQAYTQENSHLHLSVTGGKTVETVQIRTTFTEAMQELLQDSRFFLCGKSITANLHHITMVEKDAVVFKDGTRVYLPKKACNDARSAWNDFWLNGDGSK